MLNKLLCIIPDNVTPISSTLEQLSRWEIYKTSSLKDAGRELRGNCYPVGLFVFDSHPQRMDELEKFLDRHSHMQWVGVFKPSDLDKVVCRDLVAEYLCDYHTEPADPVRLAYTLGHAHGWAMLKHHMADAAAKVAGPASPLIGSCDAMAILRRTVRRVARVSAPVLVWGESGSGKELTAQAIHDNSERASGPFVPINCGAVSPTLIHSELFGYERGAFTGASQGRAGLIESAHGGTLFLDEIGDLPKEMQANLLRFLQEGTICRLGSTRQTRVDVRVIAASHVELQQAVAEGAFREDLYYRLAVLPVTVPALRERREDLVILAEHFFNMYAKERPPRLKGFSRDAFAAILEHRWPGNVRELINRVRRALVMSDGHLITPEDLDLGNSKTVLVLGERHKRSERAALRECLDRNGQNVSRAAREMGVSRTTMYRMLNRHDLRPDGDTPMVAGAFV